MDPVDTLYDEHELILRFADLLAGAHVRIERGDLPPSAFFEKCVSFARSFVDEYHHFKEEDVLFALLSQKAGQDLSGQLALLRSQHDLGRAIVDQMARSIHGYGSQAAAKKDLLPDRLGAYTDLLRQHVQLEDRVILPLARESFTPEEVNHIAAQYEAERRRFGWGVFERGRKLLAEMGALLTHT